MDNPMMIIRNLITCIYQESIHATVQQEELIY